MKFQYCVRVRIDSWVVSKVHFLAHAVPSKSWFCFFYVYFIFHSSINYFKSEVPPLACLLTPHLAADTQVSIGFSKHLFFIYGFSWAAEEA